VQPAPLLAVIAFAMLVIALVVLIATAKARRQQLTASAEPIVPQATPLVPSEHQSAEGLVPSERQQGVEQDADAAWQQRVLAFAVELRGSLTSAELHETIARKLPPMIGVDQLWIETSVGGRRRVISSPISTDGPTLHPLHEAAGEWATFPLRSADNIVGVIGVPVTDRPLAPAARRALASLAPLLGDSLQTAQTIAQLRELSTIDSVTGCATRPDGLERLRAELKRAQRANRQVAVLMLDLDYFKSINDRYGHQCGDSVLAAIGHTIMQTLRVSDLRCRWGGEEFLVALPESGLDQAKRVAVTLARRIAATITEYDSARIQLTTSVGLTIAVPGEEDLEAVLARADAALYRAKADGRNCIRVVLAHPEEGTIAHTPPAPLPFRERRNPEQPDRRQYRGPGRRTTDFSSRQRPPATTDVSDADEARVRATPV
jgi:diguanylate cyclase (GGDEF)-like protein